MNSRSATRLYVLVVLLAQTLSWRGASSVDILEELSHLVENEQMTETKPFRGFGKGSELEGAYKCDVRFNFHGNSERALMRQLLKIPSIQSFIITYVATLIFDAAHYGKAPLPSQKSVERIAKACEAFIYKNSGFNTSLMAFFPQEYDETLHYWVQKPGDIIAVTRILKDMNIPKEMLVSLQLGDNRPPHLTELFGSERTIERDQLPPDFDSTGVHLSFGALLYLFQNDYPKAWATWSNNNPNITSVFDAGKKYAYRPFSDDPDASFIDPRTYYISRHFLDEAKRQGRDLALLTTWATTLKENRINHERGEVLPWSTNNVDVAVIANYFAGIISSVTFGLVDPHAINDDTDFNILLDSCADFVVYLLEINFADRIDIAVLYYPSLIQTYWFIGRGLMLMENGRTNGPLHVPALERYYHKLAKVMRNDITNRLIEMRTIGYNGDVFYDDFLGNADFSYYDRPIRRHEDRIFTTSMAANSLLTIWTVHDQVNGLRWIEGTPDIVTETVQGCARWLQANTLTGEYSLTSIFFSRDFNFDALPFWYPANRFEYINGTKIENFTIIPDELAPIGVQGYVEPAEYEDMLKVEQFGIPRPGEFNGWNNSTGSLLFFSSDAFTYASVMMTLSMADQLEKILTAHWKNSAKSIA